MRYSREHELEADRLGVHLMSQAAYDPRMLIDVMRILVEANDGQAYRSFSAPIPIPAIG